MNSLRKVLGFLMAAFLLGAFAQPAFADGADEKFTFVVPTTASAGAQTITATLATQVGDDDRIKSFKIYAPAGVTINSASATGVLPANLSIAPAAPATGNVLSVKNVSLSRTARTITVTMNVTFPSNACTSTVYTWNAKAWEDTSFSSGAYVLSATGSNVKTTVAAVCYTVTGTASPSSAAGSVSCQSPVAPGGSSTCTTTANPGYKIDHFSAGCVPAGTNCTVSNVQANTGVTAYFVLIQYAVNGSNSPGGSVSCDSPKTYGQSSTCTATVTPGYNLTGFTNCARIGMTNQCTVSNITADTAVTANVTAYTVDTKTNTGTGFGTVSCGPLQQPSGTITCTATASTDTLTLSRFNKWNTDCSSSTTNICTLDMTTGNKTISAEFVRRLVVTGLPSSGSSTASCTSPVDYGASSTCTAYPEGSAFLASFTANCPRIGTTNTCTVTNVTVDTRVTAAFTAAVGNVGCTSSNYASNNGKVDPDLTYVNLDSTIPSGSTTPIGATSGDYGIRRGPNYDDLTGANPCVLVGVNLTKTDNIAKFTYDKSFGQKGSFKYTIVWDEQPVDPSGDTTSWTSNRPKVAWVTTDYPALTGDPVFVPALACVDDDLTLGTSLMPVLPNVPPFDGTGVSATYSDYRADGTKQAKMCVAQHGWISNQTLSGVIQVIYWDKIVDLSDGFTAPR